MKRERATHDAQDSLLLFILEDAMPDILANTYSFEDLAWSYHWEQALCCL
jgi:hypothetical protein